MKKLEEALRQLSFNDARIVSDFIQSNEWNDIPKGFSEITERVGVVKLEIEQPVELADKLEFHRKAIDLHYVVSGIDKVYQKPLANCTDLYLQYQEKDDYDLYSDEPAQVMELSNGYAIYFGSEMAHMALCGKGKVQKLIFKIKVS